VFFASGFLMVVPDFLDAVVFDDVARLGNVDTLDG
jgi:hypothetical protein